MQPRLASTGSVGNPPTSSGAFGRSGNGNESRSSTQRAWARGDDLAIFQIGDPLDVTPFLACVKPLDELDQRLLAFVAHDAVDLGKVR